MHDREWYLLVALIGKRKERRREGSSSRRREKKEEKGCCGWLLTTPRRASPARIEEREKKSQREGGRDVDRPPFKSFYGSFFGKPGGGGRVPEGKRKEGETSRQGLIA